MLSLSIMCPKTIEFAGRFIKGRSKTSSVILIALGPDTRTIPKAPSGAVAMAQMVVFSIIF